MRQPLQRVDKWEPSLTINNYRGQLLMKLVIQIKIRAQPDYKKKIDQKVGQTSMCTHDESMNVQGEHCKNAKS